MKQIVDELLAAPPEPAGEHPAAPARPLREVEDAVDRGKDRWVGRWSVRAVDEEPPWLRLTGVDGVRVSREDPAVVLTVWAEDRQTFWACLARDGPSTADRLHTHPEVLRVVRAVVDDALAPWRGRLTRRPKGWQGSDARAGCSSMQRCDPWGRSPARRGRPREPLGALDQPRAGGSQAGRSRSRFVMRAVASRCPSSSVTATS